MLTIRKAQWNALIHSREQAFEKRAVAYVQEHYPDVCREIGEEGVAKSVHQAMEKRTKYNFASVTEILLYIDLMYLLGFQFDNDETFAWAGELLADADIDGETRLLLIKQRALREIGARGEVDSIHV